MFAFVQAYEAEFRIRHSLACPPSNLYSHINDMTIRQGVIIADIALAVYISDMKTMVTSSIQEDLKVDRNAEDTFDNVSPKERLRFLKKWIKAENPFSYEGGHSKTLYAPSVHHGRISLSACPIWKIRRYLCMNLHRCYFPWRNQ